MKPEISTESNNLIDYTSLRDILDGTKPAAVVDKKGHLLLITDAKSQDHKFGGGTYLIGDRGNYWRVNSSDPERNLFVPEQSISNIALYIEKFGELIRGSELKVHVFKGGSSWELANQIQTEKDHNNHFCFKSYHK